MARQVFCQKYQKEMDGLDFAPFPGVKGEFFFENISKQAWQEWLQHQTTLINEKRLNVFEPESKKFLEEQREKFFSNDETIEKAEGWKPE
ncbi:oxidative damage protection protein [Acinetobacter sp. ESL0695]|uniref:oxidative damage protection protein n=1 Tax=Acinetobacter sp. ESL0695 TaxID=2983215 RepID=UPI0023EF6EB9|nr:oxidative damage protection protein [Acinetobacter sp. ESL0695]WEV48755.1 oxidative damage protection protein [Acinetobacter sp. ESL0695]